MDRINVLQLEITDLRKILAEKEKELYELNKNFLVQSNGSIDVFPDNNQCQYDLKNCPNVQIGDKLPRWAIERYSRQIILSEIGVSGQVKISSAKVLVVGAGGLGCPVATYLAGAGVGEIGIVDYDTVDITNLHRQVLYNEQNQNVSKVQAAANALRKLNSNIKITPYNLQLDSATALDIISGYDLVLDCSDNVPTRYLLNDACVIIKIPLISGSALKMEGQLTIYNYKDEGISGPCYRCVFPAPPPAAAAGSCASHGVCGPVLGAIGSLQALEAIKIIIGSPHTKMLVGRLLIFDGEDISFRIVKLRGKSPECAVCSENPSVTQLLDYEAFCRARAKEKDLELSILPPKHRINATDLAKRLETQNSEQRHLLVDVRTAVEFQMCRLEGAVNFPIDNLASEREFNELKEMVTSPSVGDVTLLCRRGNDSQIVTQRLLEELVGLSDRFKDLTGGLHAWSKEVDSQFPLY